MTLLDKAAILAANDITTEDVAVPEWGGTVRVKALTGWERDEWQASLTIRRPIPSGPNKGQLETVPDQMNVNAKLAAVVMVDESGARMFTDQDVIALGGKSAAALTRVTDVATRLSGLSTDEAEVISGNSEAVPSDGSTSSAPTQPESL